MKDEKKQAENAFFHLITSNCSKNTLSWPSSYKTLAIFYHGFSNNQNRGSRCRFTAFNYPVAYQHDNQKLF